MEEYDMPDDEFESLYEQELELMKELSANKSSDHFPSDAEQFDQTFEETLNNKEKPQGIKKRLFEDFIAPVGIKRQKVSFPKFGYEKEKPAIDPDFATIDLIISNRKVAHSSNLSANSKTTGLGNNTNKRKTIFHEHIPSGDFQAITTELGKRVYLEVEDERIFESSVDRVGETKGRVQLLSVPYRELRIEAEKELLALHSIILSADRAEPNERTQETSESDGNDLWVNKYKPRTYLDLLSDELTNRTVLHWMKLWDKLVFGIERKSQKQEKVNKSRPNFFNKFGPEVINEFDELGRPQQKVVLLCGPPGLGKTTLAHIIAAHAGYNVVEMNASDDRSVDTFRTNLENATTMKSVIGFDKRPNCLVIDEIDGAPAPSVNLLVNLLTSKKTKTESRPKKKDNFILLRPVICICNDLYTLSLRPLKQIALVIQFPPTHSTKLAQRLLSISHKQRLKADLSVLLALCNKTENDIRACLSVLQFVRITSKELKFLDLEGVTVGQKDYQRSLFAVWHDIFTLPRPKRGPRINPHQQNALECVLNDSASAAAKPVTEFVDPTTPASRFSHILKVAQSCGEFEKLTLGWFENYLLMKFKHVHLEPVVAGLEWATMSDIFQKEILHSQTWILGGYLPLSFVAYHFLFSSYNWPKLHFPNQFSEFNSSLTKSRALLDLMTGGMSAEAQVFSPKSCLVQDILPYLAFILQPTLRPVNVQLFSQKEKVQLSQLVNTMISYNLTYVQEKNNEGSYSFMLDPNIEEVVHFASLPQPRSIPYSSKQLVAREVELEKVRRAERYFFNDVQEKEDCKRSTKSIFMKSSDILKSKRNELQNPKKENKDVAFKPSLELNPRKITSLQGSNMLPRDFFGRVIQPTVKNSTNNTKSTILRSDIWFKFKEGYSNAVRRQSKVKDFV